MKNYTQSQMMLPFLGVLSELDAPSRAADVYDRLAERMGVSDAQRAERVEIGSQSFNAFERDVRWVQQRAKAAGLVAVPSRNQWEITGKGRNSLRVASPGVVLTVWTDGHGRVLWGAIEDAVGEIRAGSVKLWMTSPPYPLLREKQYGNLDSKRHVAWLRDVFEALKPTLAETGSLVINLGDVYRRGAPVLDLYAERLLLELVDDLGYHLAGRFEWQNPSKLPAPAEWVTVRRVRVKSSLERCYWLSKTEQPYADNREVLVPYSASMRSRIAAGGERGALRPSGHDLAQGAFGADHGGAIPGNLLVAANTESNGRYMDYCRQQDLPIHPARFPSALPEFFIKMLTKKGDMVGDCFSGRLKTPHVARDLGRRYVAIEKCLDYIIGGVGGRLAPC